MLIVQNCEHNILAAFSTIKNGIFYFLFFTLPNSVLLPGWGNLRSGLHNTSLNNNVEHPGSVDSQSV